MKELRKTTAMQPNEPTQILLFEEDYQLIKSTLHNCRLNSGWFTLNKDKRVKGIYEFQPKGKSYYINISNQ